MGAAPATGGKSSSLEHSTVRHCTAILIALQGSATHPCIQPRFTEAESAGANLTREEVIAALLSPSIKWMGEFDEVGNAQKFVFTEICKTPKNLPTQIYPLSLLAQVRVSPFSFFNRLSTTITTRRLLQALQPLDCMPTINVDFNPHNISCAALDCLDREENLFWMRQEYGTTVACN